MTKNILKEIIIILLLTLAIILVLGVLLYEFVPANKIIPEKVAYTTPEEVKKELETVVSDDEEQYFDYHIDSTQIKNYQKIQEYVPGRKNPFGELESAETANSENTENQNNKNNSNNNDSSNRESTANKENTVNKENTGSTASSETSTEAQENNGYLPDKGTK